MIPINITIDNLKKLPLRAIVAFAGRCARRVQSLSQLPEDHPEKERRRATIEAAIQMAESFSNGSTCSSVEQVVQAADAAREVVGDVPGGDHAAAAAAEAAHAAASAWDALDSEESERGMSMSPWVKTADALNFLDQLANTTADLTTLSALSAAEEAASTAGEHNEAFVAAAIQDYEKLLGLKLGSYPEAGQPIDPSPDGPLGPL